MKKIVLICLIIFVQLTLAQTSKEYKRIQLQALKNIKGVGIYVWDIENINDLNKKIRNTLISKKIEIFVEKELKKNRLKTVSFEKANTLAGAPCFDVQIKIKTDDFSGFCLYFVEGRFVQDVFLARNKRIKHLSTITWRDSDFGIVFVENLKDNIYKSLKKIINKFSKEFRRVNR